MSRFLSKRFSEIEAYVPGEQPQDKKYIKLNTNESPFPPSEKSKVRLDDAQLSAVKLYPDPECAALRDKLAEFYGLTRERVIVSNGSDEVLSFVFMAFFDKDKPVVFPDISYGFYKVFAELYGVPYTEIPLEEDFSIDCQKYFGIGKNIVIANPNAPTGIEISQADIERMLKTNPNNIVVIDEAYVDFGGTSALPLLEKYDNLIVVQTFSKSRSGAGLRLGYAMSSPEIIADLNKMRYSTNPYNINRLTLAFGEAIVDDNGYYEENCRRIRSIRENTTQRLKKLGFCTTDSKANFIFARHPKLSGEKLYLALKDMGILVRHFNKPKIQDWLRITVGTEEEMDALCAALEKCERS